MAEVNSPLSEQLMLTMIRKELEQRIATVAAEEIKAAQEQIEVRLREQLGHVAISILKQYEVSSYEGMMTIRIKNEMP